MDSDFLRAAHRGDLPRVQRMLANGEARTTETGSGGGTALLSASRSVDSLPTLIWLLAEGGAKITERDDIGFSALMLAALFGNFTTCQWLLEHGGADIAEVNDEGKDVWWMLLQYLSTDTAKSTALLRVMVLRGAPPAKLMVIIKHEKRKHD
jgi:ankyrin repeat protein